MENGRTQAKMASGNFGMEKLILAMNKMLDVCTQTGTNVQFDLPHIAVVGSQSAGKSSVLESFVGRDFLPRGSGVVTRRPLILKLVNGPEEYGEFLHCKDKKFFNFNDIRSEIKTNTDRITSSSKGISNDPINLCIYSPKVLNLTLIDLPGITKVPIGDQPADIEEQVREMILSYIRKDNCLILAVTPANSDLANSDALKLAREVDKDGIRTIGVITKLDLMDQGTDARDILENKLLPLRRGYVGVVNRSQKDIDDQKDVAAALKAERDFFTRHKYYRHFADRLGTPYLQQVLNKQLTEHIRDKLPGLQDRLRKKMVSLEKDVQEFDKLHPDDPETMKPVMLDIIRQLQLDFEKAIGTLGSEVVDTHKLTSGAKINLVFHERLPSEISNISYDKQRMSREINFAIRNIYGIRVVLFTPYMVFEALVREQISRLKEPIVVCIDLVVEELTAAVRNCTQRMSNYPKLREIIENNIITYIHCNEPSYKQKILSVIDMELAYMNIKHEEFMTNVKHHINPNKATTSSVADTSDTVVTTTARPASPQGELILNSDDTASQSVDHQKIFRKGHLSFVNSGTAIANEYWFVLASKTLSWYENKDENDRIFTIPLDGLKIRDEQDTIVLFNPDGRNVYQDLTQMELSCKNPDEIRSWRDSFSRVFGNEEKTKPKKGKKDKSKDKKKLEEHESEEADPTLNAKVNDIYEKIDSYTRIVRKTARDMIPKAITLYIIKELINYINKDLLVSLLAIPCEDYSKVFAMSPDEAEKHKEKSRTYKACTEALEIIRDVPIDNNIDSIVSDDE